MLKKFPERQPNQCRFGSDITMYGTIISKHVDSTCECICSCCLRGYSGDKRHRRVRCKMHSSPLCTPAVFCTQNQSLKVPYSSKRLVATCDSFFWFIVFFLHDTDSNRCNILLLLEATGSRVEAGLQEEEEYCGIMWFFRPKSVEELPCVPNWTRTYAPQIRGSNDPASECPPAQVRHYYHSDCPYPTAW